MIQKAAIVFNGITIGYVMGLVNGVLAALLAFGIQISPQEQAAVFALVNAALVLVVHVAHRVGEATALGHQAPSAPVASVTAVSEPSTVTTTG